MDKNDTFEWTSKRVPPGGVFHHPKVTYSKETHQILKTLMEESKLSLYQQKQIDWNLRNGLSLVDAKDQTNKHRSQSAGSHVRNPPKISRRRPLSSIKSSGDLERDCNFRFEPNKRGEDRELVKTRLQHIMEFGKKHNQYSLLRQEEDGKKERLPGKYDILQDLLSQIKEREDWLKEMEALGEGSKHREMIHHQIAERIRRLELLNFPEDFIDLHIDGKKISNRSDKDDGSKSSKDTDSKRSSVKAKSDKTCSICGSKPVSNHRKKNKEENIADIISYI